ncbi:hypothetical protein E3N88_34829 [Mikania micrantha]|uniref:Uncharacterized protein n=1 Tax=Mikania micrantha TaxID=192012 RepID=A0A5N6LZ88_9ASTR|nr:hypothetical protein E3N88_34829 [Mikania micrantha]
MIISSATLPSIDVACVSDQKEEKQGSHYPTTLDGDTTKSRQRRGGRPGHLTTVARVQISSDGWGSNKAYWRPRLALNDYGPTVLCYWARGKCLGRFQGSKEIEAGRTVVSHSGHNPIKSMRGISSEPKVRRKMVRDSMYNGSVKVRAPVKGFGVSRVRG